MGEERRGGSLGIEIQDTAGFDSFNTHLFALMQSLALCELCCIIAGTRLIMADILIRLVRNQQRRLGKHLKPGQDEGVNI